MTTSSLRLARWLSWAGTWGILASGCTASPGGDVLHFQPVVILTLLGACLTILYHRITGHRESSGSDEE